MKEIQVFDYADKIVKILSNGAFLNTCAEGKSNSMTIAWGSLGFMWGKPVFTVMVRQSRHTYQLIEKNPEFTVTIPLKDMKHALGICGSTSGGNTDKFPVAGLIAHPGQKVSTPAIANAGINIECKVICRQEMSRQGLDPTTADKWYESEDWHVMYYGEILTAYKD